MRFQSIRSRIVTAIPQLSLIKSACVAGGLVLAAFSQAQWQDPLETPSLVTHRAHESLLLDITRAGDRLVAVGAHGHIIYSDDSGQSWEQSHAPSSTTLTAVYFPNEQSGWAVGHDGLILKSQDAGENWVKQFDGYSANKAIVKGAQSLKSEALAALQMAEDSDDPTMIEDAEMTLENVTFALEDAQYDESTGSTKPFLDVWFHDENSGFAVGAYGMAFHTSDGGKSWVDWSANLENDGRLHINGLTELSSGSLMLVGEQGLVLRSDDLGKSWKEFPSPYDGSYFGIMSAGNNVFMYGLRSNLYKLVDGEMNWERILIDSEQTLMSGTETSNHQLVLVGNGGTYIQLDPKSGTSESLILPGRKASAAAVEAPDGSVVTVGEAGVNRIDRRGAIIEENITMFKEGL